MKILATTSFRYKIFLAIVGVNLLFMMAMVSFNFYKDTQWIYSFKRQNLVKIESRIEGVLEREIKTNGISEDLLANVQNELDRLILPQNIGVILYDEQGKEMLSYQSSKNISQEILSQFSTENEYVFLEDEKDEIQYYHLYRNLYAKGKSVGIIEVYEKTEKALWIDNLYLIVKQYFLAICLIFMLSIYLAWFISQKLMKRVEILTKQLPKTNIEYLDTPILEYKGKDEISPLIESYNTMLVKLKHQTENLAQTEKEESWRAMAEQIAHDIRNPLTPLKLSVQNFQRKYNPDDEGNEDKIKKLVATITHQVEVIYAITQSLSEFSKSSLESEKIEVVKALRQSLGIFPEEIVSFNTNVDELYYDNINGVYFTRIITNIVKNAIQSITRPNKEVKVSLEDKDTKFLISIEDNGNGIAKENQDKVFDRKFTTKSSGTGVGLFIVKNIVEKSNGKIWFETEEGKGTIFYIEFYK